jgi:hypothetical protein
MAFRAEQRRHKRLLSPGEEILASDLLGGIHEMPHLSRPPVLVVSDQAIYILLSGREANELRIEFDQLAGVGRKSNIFIREIQLILKGDDGRAASALTCAFHPRDRHGLTGDLITERFFGRVIKDTTVELQGDQSDE